MSVIEDKIRTHADPDLRALGREVGDLILASKKGRKCFEDHLDLVHDPRLAAKATLADIFTAKAVN